MITMKVASLLAMAATLVVASHAAAQCTLAADGVAFGNYDPLSNRALDSTGTISVKCQAATSYAVSISTGFGTYGSRAMVLGSHALAYNLFTDPAHSIVWGDGPGGTCIMWGSSASARFTVF